MTPDRLNIPETNTPPIYTVNKTNPTDSWSKAIAERPVTDTADPKFFEKIGEHVEELAMLKGIRGFYILERSHASWRHLLFVAIQEQAKEVNVDALEDFNDNLRMPAQGLSLTIIERPGSWVPQFSNQSASQERNTRKAVGFILLEQ